MADHIIDLRNPDTAIEKQNRIVVVPKEIKMEWTAKEYERKKRTSSWFLALGGVATVLAVIGIFAQNYFFVGFTALAYIILILYEKRGLPEIYFAVIGDGVRVGSVLYRYADLKSFCILEEVNELSLETKQTLVPFVRIPLRGADKEKIRMLLKNLLPEAEHKDFISDQIARNL